MIKRIKSNLCVVISVGDVVAVAIANVSRCFCEVEGNRQMLEKHGDKIQITIMQILENRIYTKLMI